MHTVLKLTPIRLLNLRLVEIEAEDNQAFTSMYWLVTVSTPVEDRIPADTIHPGLNLVHSIVSALYKSRMCVWSYVWLSILKHGPVELPITSA